jgi:hypothetical protein
MRGGTITSPNAHDDARLDALPDAHGPNSHRSSLDSHRSSRSLDIPRNTRSEDSSRSRIHNGDTHIRIRSVHNPQGRRRC